jgi:hypothetical protein
MIHVFAEAEENNKIFMKKWDVRDGFWRMDCREGEQWNFVYVLPKPLAMPVTLVILLSLQIGWVESPPFFCTATETSWDIAMQYCNTKVGSLKDHKFATYLMGKDNFEAFCQTDSQWPFLYLLEVDVDNFMLLMIPTSREQMLQVTTAVVTGIHDVFPEDDDDMNDPILLKKMKKGESQLSMHKMLLGFHFDGEIKTIWLENEKRDKLLIILHKWPWSSMRGCFGIPFDEFQSVTSKILYINPGQKWTDVPM